MQTVWGYGRSRRAGRAGILVQKALAVVWPWGWQLPARMPVYCHWFTPAMEASSRFFMGLQVERRGTGSRPVRHSAWST